MTAVSIPRQSAETQQLGNYQATHLLPKSPGVRLKSAVAVVDVDNRRTRKPHKKVRTGCLTCKVRRKKCDETKPACNRCTSTGRTCDGYGATIDQPADVVHESINEAVRRNRANTTPRAHRSPPSPRSCSPAGLTPENRLEIFATGTPCGHTSGASTFSEYGTSISEAIEDAEVEAFISDFVDTEEERDREAFYQVAPYLSQGHFDIIRAPNMFPESAKFTDLELHCFSQFRFQTGPQFASYFDSSFWRRYCTMFALSHPVVFAAATALGAVHQRYMYGISREAFEYCSHAHRLKLKAQKMLTQFRTDYENKSLTRASSFNTGLNVHDRDIIMASEMLLGLFEGFQENWDTSLGHLKMGLAYLLNRPMRLTYSEITHVPSRTTFSGFMNFIERIKKCASQLFETPTCTLAKRGTGQSLPEVPFEFNDLDEARDYMFTEAEWILSMPLSELHNEDAREKTQVFHITRILRWSVAYANTIYKMERTTRQKRCCVLMKLLRIPLFYLLYLLVDEDIRFNADTCAGYEDLTAELAFAQTSLWNAIAARDDLLGNWERIQVLGDAIVDEKNMFFYVEHSVEFDSAVGPPKANKQLIESSAKTKHLVKILLSKSIDGTSKILGAYCVAERLSAIEEHAVLEAAKLLIPPNIKLKWVDVACILEDRKILLKYCYQDEAEGGTIWTQQWWEF